MQMLGFFSNLLIAREMEEEGNTTIHILWIKVKYVALQINFSSDGWKIAGMLKADIDSISIKANCTALEWPWYIKYFSRFK